MTLWTNSYDRRSYRRNDPTGHLMNVKMTVDSTVTNSSVDPNILWINPVSCTEDISSDNRCPPI